MFFIVLVCFVIFQRITELFIARRNERNMLKQGGYEVGKEHYKFLVLLHICFFLSLFIEGYFFHNKSIFGWQFFFIFFLILQLLRVWTICSLGKFWNTKIIVLPDATPISKGPYRWIKHPNYLIVILELLIIPLMFQAYWTAFIFTILNLILLLKVRIPLEEQALKEVTIYQKQLGSKKRFLP